TMKSEVRSQKSEVRSQKSEVRKRRCTDYRFLLTAFCLLLSAFCFPVFAQQTEISPSARAALDKAVEALQRGALDDAERSARSAVQASPRSPLPHNVLGVILDRLGRADAAFAEFNQSIKLDPNFVGARNNLARMMAERGKV